MNGSFVVAAILAAGFLAGSRATVAADLGNEPIAVQVQAAERRWVAILVMTMDVTPLRVAWVGIHIVVVAIVPKAVERVVTVAVMIARVGVLTSWREARPGLLVTGPVRRAGWRRRRNTAVGVSVRRTRGAALNTVAKYAV
jgi:hypothetical protein